MTRTGTVIKMFNHQGGSVSRRELRQGQSSSQQFAYVGDRESRQDVDLVVFIQCRVTSIEGRPFNLGFGDKPGSQNGQSQMVLPSAEFSSLKIIRAQLGLGILVGTLGEVAGRFACGQDEEGGVGRGIAQGVSVPTGVLPESIAPMSVRA